MDILGMFSEVQELRQARKSYETRNANLLKCLKTYSNVVRKVYSHVGVDMPLDFGGMFHYFTESMESVEEHCEMYECPEQFEEIAANELRYIIPLAEERRRFESLSMDARVAIRRNEECEQQLRIMQKKIGEQAKYIIEMNAANVILADKLMGRSNDD